MKQCKPLRGSQLKKNLFFFEFSRVSPSDQPLAKDPDDSGYEIGIILKGVLYEGVLNAFKYMGISVVHPPIQAVLRLAFSGVLFSKLAAKSFGFKGIFLIPFQQTTGYFSYKQTQRVY